MPGSEQSPEQGRQFASHQGTLLFRRALRPDAPQQVAEQAADTRYPAIGPREYGSRQTKSALPQPGRSRVKLALGSMAPFQPAEQAV